jgi:hypothetical protein
MELMQLQWEGPFRLGGVERGGEKGVPGKRGLYMLVTGAPESRRIAYVGQSRDLRDAVYSHLAETLGGLRPLYNPEALQAGDALDPVYDGKGKNFVSQFTADFGRLSGIALANVTSYEVFWARLNQKRRGREVAQSALIAHALQTGIPIQNRKPPRPQEKCERTTVESQLPDGIEIQGHAPELRYGVRQLPPTNGAVEPAGIDPTS